MWSTTDNHQPFHQDVRTGAQMFKAGGLRMLNDVTGIVKGEGRPFKFRNKDEDEEDVFATLGAALKTNGCWCSSAQDAAGE